MALLQYYGGTNYARTAASFVTTRYYDEAPIDEYGEGPFASSHIHFLFNSCSTLDEQFIFIKVEMNTTLGLVREPKWGHLRDLHRALLLTKKALFEGNYGVTEINPDLEVKLKTRLGWSISLLGGGGFFLFFLPRFHQINKISKTF